MSQTKLVSLSAVFLFILAAIFSSFPFGVAHGESQSQVSPPEGFGPYSDGWINRGIPRTLGGILQISVHYPAISLGEEAEPDATEAPYPTLLFSPGFMTSMVVYWSFAGGITSWGFVCVIVGSDPRAEDSERANDLIDALNWLDEQNDNSSFKLSQLMDESKFGVLGHSLGGMATVIACGSEPRFKVSVPIAPFVISPGLAADTHVPILIIVGSDDTISPPDIMSYPLYNMANPPKLYITLTGVDHFDVVFEFMSFKYVISFLKLYLYEDQDYAEYLYGATAQQEIDDGKIKLMYDLRRVTEHKVLINGDQYTILTYSNSTLLNLVFNQTLNQVNFTVTGPPDTTGTVNITIPKQLIPAGYDVEVHFDGESYPFALTQNSACYFVFFMYTHSQHQITISFVPTSTGLRVFYAFWEGVFYRVTVLSNSSISAFEFSQSDEEIGFNVTCPDAASGFCNVTIPETLLWVDVVNEWMVIIDGTPLSTEERTVAYNGTHYSIYFTYGTGIHEVAIKGAWVVPEFPAAMVTSLLLIATLAAAFLGRIFWLKKRRGPVVGNRSRPYPPQTLNRHERLDHPIFFALRDMTITKTW